MIAHPFADRFPMLGAEDLDRLAADETLQLSGGTADAYLFVCIRRDDDRNEFFHVSAMSGGMQSYTKRPVAPSFVAAQMSALVRDLGAESVTLTSLRVEKRSTPTRNEYVYFVRDVLGNIKIGFASNVSSRLKALQTANSVPLTLLGSIPASMSDEKALHARFADDHLRGEWFKPSEALTAYIAEVTGR